MAIANIDWRDFLESEPKLPDEYEAKVDTILSSVRNLWADESQRTLVKKAFGFLYPNVVNEAFGDDGVELFKPELEALSLSQKSNNELARIAIGFYLDELEAVKVDVDITYILNEVIDSEGREISRDYFLH